MKTPLLIPLLTLAAGLTVRAQSPGGPPPPPPPGTSGTMTLNQPGPQSDDRERAMHIGEAIKHLRVAGLGEMAQHIEQMLQQQNQQQQRRGGPGPSGPGASGGMPSGQFQLQPPQPRRPSGPPQSFNRPMPFNPGGPGAGPDRRTPNPRMRSGDNDELRAQVQRLTREVEELRRQINSRMNEHRQGGPRDGDKRDGDRRDGDRRGGDHPEQRPQGNRPDAKPQGDQPRPPSDGPRREHRDSPPEPKRDGVEEVKPALAPGSDAIE